MSPRGTPGASEKNSMFLGTPFLMAPVPGNMLNYEQMTIRVSPLNLSMAEEESALPEKTAEILQVSLNDLRDFRIIKKSLDARRKNRIHFVYAVEFSLPPEQEQSLLRQPPPALQVEEVPPKTLPSPAILKSKPRHRPLIVGTGPAGLFAAWKLTQMRPSPPHPGKGQGSFGPN